MENNRSLEFLSGIKNASSSKAVEKLFQEIQDQAVTPTTHKRPLEETAHSIQAEELREDKVSKSSEKEKEIIRNNFPRSKENFLVVAKEVDN